MRLIALTTLLMLAGCTTTARITNTPVNDVIPLETGRFTSGRYGQREDSALFFISFSGGGTRAAALSYGVLEELRDTTFTFDGEEKRLLDEIDLISSVSGGSFTAAYYALYGDRIFEDYEEVFLRRNIQRTLINSILNPLNWPSMLFTKMNRTELAINQYDKNIFHGGTFADIQARGGPFVEINATDLGIGKRFSFTQQRFNMLCSDLGSFSVARAVAASSAVPILFKPVTLQNYDSCEYEDPPWIAHARKNMDQDERKRNWVETSDSYQDKKQRQYIHLMDGGITDNLGIRSLYERIEAAGGALRALKNSNIPLPKHFIVIVVNAEIRPADPMDSSIKSPTNREVIAAVSTTQIARYNLESILLLQNALERWTAELSTPENKVTPYFIKLDFESIADRKIRLIFNSISTSFSLPNKEVDKLIKAGRTLLRQSPDYQRLIALIREAEQNAMASSREQRNTE